MIRSSFFASIGTSRRTAPPPPSGGGGGSLPAYYTAATANQWTQLANSTFSSSGVGWSGTNPGGGGGYVAVVYAWCGGILNTVGLDYGSGFVAGTWLVIWGGGHTDYAGNEIYAFGPFEATTPQWRRVTNPTIPAATDTGRTSGNPVARHTYDMIQFDATRNRMITLSGAGIYQNGFSTNNSDAWDFANRTWSALPDVLSNGGGINNVEACSVYDGDRYAYHWPVGNNQILTRVDLLNNTASSWSKDFPGDRNAVKAAYHPTYQVMAIVDNGTLRAFDLRNPASNTVYAPTVSGSGPSDSVAMNYEASTGRFVAWANSGKTLYYLTLPANPYAGGSTWVWSSTTPGAGATPAAQTANGTFGRFQWSNGDGVDTPRCGILMPNYNQPIYIFKT